MQEVDQVAFHTSYCQWYPKFHKDSLTSEIINLSEEFCAYLESDGCFIPKEALKDEDDFQFEWSDGTVGQAQSEDEDEEQPSFPELSEQIQGVLDDYKSIVIKLNWNTPSDAIWVSYNKTLKCSNLEDVYLLLKNSNNILKNLDMIKNKNNKYSSLKPCLIIKKWKDIDPATEFRCYVVNKKLVGICQRDTSQYHEYIEKEKYDITQDIKSLFEEKIMDKFELNTYSFDVIRYKKDRVRIMDFGPLNESYTKNMLFTEEELRSLNENLPEFRFIAEHMGIQPKNSNHYCIPKDIDDFFSKNKNVTVMEAIVEEVTKMRMEPETSDLDE
ncbi:hypothetical protein TKK_0000580 [Trichogramma kaykai]|uniref:Cell division cycle protein 123 homolog n=1 Tax=Trichogramma kaykai TaxID=54128 RepID=A0ABD2VZS8_9HYME